MATGNVTLVSDAGGHAAEVAAAGSCASSAEQDLALFGRQIGQRGRDRDPAVLLLRAYDDLVGDIGVMLDPRGCLPDEAAARPIDRVDRNFTAARPNQLWCADFTYVPTWTGMIYVAFVFDVFSRRILDWRVATAMTTPLVFDTLEIGLPLVAWGHR